MQVVDVILILLTISSLIVSVYLFVKFKQLNQNYTHLTRGVVKGNLQDVLKVHLKRVEDGERKLEELEEETNNFIKKASSHFQKIGFKRFNPFQETGGNQSFVLALLDKNNNGILISSLHQRDSTRVYAKEVNKGQTKQKLSDEEKEVINNVLNK